MRKTIIPAALFLIFVTTMLVFFAAISHEDDSDGIDSGVVIQRSRGSLTVREDDGERDKHSIYKYSNKCQVGQRWPACSL